jgi:hypothetical protein
MPSCPVCKNDIEEGDDWIQCEGGHATYPDCLSVYVNHAKDIKELKENGLCCCATQGNAQCTQKHPFDKIVNALTGARIEEINKTLVKRKLRNLEIWDESCAVCLENHRFKKEIVKLGCACKKRLLPRVHSTLVAITKRWSLPNVPRSIQRTYSSSIISFAKNYRSKLGSKACCK